MILSYTKPFHEKMRKQLVKIWKKKHVCDFSTLSIKDMKTEKKTKRVLLI